tara:strand:- start:21151 stop:21606 length:456 start_codon:yes stop_codon:yes gene_type:complete
MKQIFTYQRLVNLILVFIITGFWDVILRAMAEGKISFLGIENMKWVTTLKDYFNYHTVLGAALIAAFVGAIAQVLIIYTFDIFNVTNKFLQLLIIFIISSLVGIPMRYSGLFPILDKYYYKPLGFTYSFITDGISGVIVAITLFLIQLYIN